MTAQRDLAAQEPTLAELEERLERNENAKRLLERLLMGLSTESRHFRKVREIVIRDLNYLLSGI